MISAALSGLVSEGFPREEEVIEFPGRNAGFNMLEQHFSEW